MVTDANNMPAPFTIIDHPLIQHKLTIMRDKQTSTAGFRRRSDADNQAYRNPDAGNGRAHP